jgi:L-ascorbate metabolism protein UlaG (beta-lactamase superfamily)
VTSVPGIHAGNAVLRALLPPVMGSVIELADGRQVRKRVYITGDTLLFSGLAEIAARFPAVDTAVVHTGGTTLPGGFIVTMTGADAAECLRVIRPRAAIPVHYDDYGLFKSGLDDVRRAVAAAGLAVELRYVSRGETVPL